MEKKHGDKSNEDMRSGYSNTLESMPNYLPEGQSDKWDPSEHLDRPHHHPHNNHRLWGNYNKCYRLFIEKTR